MSRQKPNVLKRSMYRNMEMNGDIERLSTSMREIITGAGLMDRMKTWTESCMSRQNPEVFNKQAMVDKLTCVGIAAIDYDTLKTEVAKKLTLTRSATHERSESRKRKRSTSSPRYSKPYPYQRYD